MTWPEHPVLLIDAVVAFNDCTQIVGAGGAVTVTLALVEAVAPSSSVTVSPTV